MKRLSKEELEKLLQDGELFGRIEGATCSSKVKGPCGDTMEFFLRVEEDRIAAAKYFTDGCGATLLCGALAAKLAQGRAVKEAMHISAGEIVKRIGVLPENHVHCGILAVTALYRALADALLTGEGKRKK